MIRNIGMAKRLTAAALTSLLVGSAAAYASIADDNPPKKHAAQASASSVAAPATPAAAPTSQKGAVSPAGVRSTTSVPECDPVTGKGSGCGWWWGARRDLSKPTDDDTPDEPEVAQQPGPVEEQPPETEEQRCSKMQTWSVTCGFVDPGKNFEWQSLERDKLKIEMVMNPETPKAVEGFQRYSKWAVNQAVAVWHMWEFNMVQNPDLQVTATEPITSFGLKALAAEKDRERDSVVDALREQGAFLVWFTRSDCTYCSYSMSSVKELGMNLNLPLYNASLDAQCEPGFSGEYCRTAESTTEPARYLKIKIVPDLMLYLPEEKAWVRIATGVVTKDVMRDRIVLFFQAAKAATENAINNKGDFTPSVDFKHVIEQQVRYGVAEGVPENGVN